MVSWQVPHGILKYVQYTHHGLIFVSHHFIMVSTFGFVTLCADVMSITKPLVISVVTGVIEKVLLVSVIIIV